MAEIFIEGAIVDNDEAWIYDLFEIPCTSPKKVRDALVTADGKDVDIYINSGGGSVFAGSEIFSVIQAYKGNVTAHITGLAASAASVVACACKCLMAPTAQMMVHNVSSYASGDYRDFDKMSEILQKANEAIAAAYVQKTGMELKDALDLMDCETWLTAKDALEYGLIDGIETNQNTNNTSEQDKQNTSLLVASLASAMLPREVVDKMQNKKKEIQLDIEMLKLGGGQK